MQKQTKLTNRQIEILSGFEEGKLYKEISSELDTTIQIENILTL